VFYYNIQDVLSSDSYRDDAALREAVLFPEHGKTRASDDAAEGLADRGRDAVIVYRDAHEHPLEQVIRQRSKK